MKPTNKMIDVIKENIGLTVSSLGGIIAWIFFGRRKANSDAVTEIQLQYKDFVVDVKSEIAGYKDDIKSMRQKNDYLQEQFNRLNLSYALEVEKSTNWEKLHFELTKKYDLLSKENEKLKKRVDFLEKCRLENKDCKINI